MQKVNIHVPRPAAPSARNRELSVKPCRYPCVQRSIALECTCRVLLGVMPMPWPHLERVIEPRIRLRLTGVVEAWSCTGESVLPRGRKAQAILAYLALTSESRVPRSRFLGLLWSTRWHDQARASLRQSVMELRSTIGRAEPTIIGIEKDALWLDHRYVWIDGLSSRPQDDTSHPRPVADPARFLEIFVGLDPEYDKWITTQRVALTGDSEPAALGGADLEHSEPRGDRELQTFDASLNEPATLLSNEKALLRPPADGHDFNPDPQFGPAAQHRLTVSVMPFVSIGRTHTETFLAPALAQEIVTALAKFRWLLVRLGQPAETVPSDYRIEGTICTLPSGFRISARLVDRREADAVVWTHSDTTGFDALEESILRLAERIVSSVDPEILALETRRIARRATISNAYECVLRAMPLLYDFTHEAWKQADSLLSQAIAIDPTFGRAFAFRALSRLTGIAQGWTKFSQLELRTISAHAARAVECDPHDSLALSISAHCRIFTQRDFDGALQMYARATNCNPNCGFAWGYSALAHAYLGDPAEATRRLQRARQVMIHDPFGSWLDTFSAVIAYFSTDWPQAIALCQRQIDARPGFTNIRKIFIAALCRADRAEDARREHAVLMQLEPEFSWAAHLETYPFGRDEDRVALALAVARCGLMDDGRSNATSGLNVVEFRSGRRST